MDNAFIDHQNLLDAQPGSFGAKGSLRNNGCGAIALYNVLSVLQMRESFDTVSEAFRRPFFTLGGGLYGTNPIGLIIFLKKRGLRIRLKTSASPRFFGFRSYILLYFYRQNKRLGAHYQAAYFKNGRLYVHNPSSISNDGILLNSFDDFEAYRKLLRGPRAMFLICIDK